MEKFARDPEADIEKLMDQMPVYKGAKTEERKIVALADAAKTALTKAQNSKDEDVQKVHMEEAKSLEDQLSKLLETNGQSPESVQEAMATGGDFRCADFCALLTKFSS